MAERIEPTDIDGRRILVGVTTLADDGSYQQEQFAGTAEFEDCGTYALVRLRCDDGEVRDYPFDTRTLQRAPAGEYRLGSMGQVVRNPDFLMTWRII